MFTLFVAFYGQELGLYEMLPADSTATATPSDDVVRAELVKVVDGDTITVAKDGDPKVTVRLLGIDTPETVHPNKDVECFGQEASSYLKTLLSDDTVLLQYDESQGMTDKYGRELAYIYKEDGTFVNRSMVSEGYAYEYTYNIPYYYQGVFQKEERDAREAERGLWSPSTCNGER